MYRLRSGRHSLPPRRVWGREEGASGTGADGNLPRARLQLAMPSLPRCGVLAAPAWTRGSPHTHPQV